MTQTVNRNSLYFNKYKYCIRMSYPYLHAIRYRKHAEIDHFVDFRLMLQEKYDLESSMYAVMRKGPLWGFHNMADVVDENSRTDLHKLLDTFDAITTDYRLTISCNDGYIYTNHLSPFDVLFEETYAEFQSIREVQCDVPEGAIRVRNSTYKYRTYFSEQILEFAAAEKLSALLINQTELRLSPALLTWAKSKGEYMYVSHWRSKYSVLRGSYFIDHDDLGILTFMSLITPIKVKKTLQIINDK